LLNQFLSPLANKRTDEYGGSHEIATALCVKSSMSCSEWKGPLFLRISSTDYVKAETARKIS
jgi:NADPH2 dehydrogenase